MARNFFDRYSFHSRQTRQPNMQSANAIDKAKAFTGIWPALLTPLLADLAIDHERFAQHSLALLANGCAGITPFGTTGEGPSFSVAERMEAIDQLVKRGVPAAQIMVSTSCAALPDVLALTRHAVQLGVHGCLMMPPFFLKGVSDQGIIDSYRYVIDSVDDPNFKLYLYHIPQVSGAGLSHHVIATLLALYPNTILGIKDSSCTTAHSVGLADTFMQHLTVYVGYEPDLPEMGRRGSTGAISGIANFMPRVVKQLVMQPDAPTTPAQHERILQLLGLLNGYSLLPALKGIMAALSGDEAWLRVRPPLVALTAAEFKMLKDAIKSFGIHTERD